MVDGSRQLMVDTMQGCALRLETYSTFSSGSRVSASRSQPSEVLQYGTKCTHFHLLAFRLNDLRFFYFGYFTCNQLSAANYHVRPIALLHVIKCVSQDIAKSIATSLIGARLDCDNAIFCGISLNNINKLQRVQNTWERVIKERGKYDHITPLLSQLHWLPIVARIKIAILTFEAISAINRSAIDRDTDPHLRFHVFGRWHMMRYELCIIIISMKYLAYKPSHRQPSTSWLDYKVAFMFIFIFAAFWRNKVKYIRLIVVLFCSLWLYGLIKQ